MDDETPLFRLPNELIHNILSRLPPQDLALLAATCRVLYHHTNDDRLWQAIVQDNVPGIDVASAALPPPITSFRELFLAHHPHWFLPRFKVWIGSESMAGKLMIARYDPRRACIEGYQLLAVKKEAAAGVPEVAAVTENDLMLSPSDASAGASTDPSPDPNLHQNQGGPVVHVFSFEPDIHLHLDRPIVELDPWLSASATGQHQQHEDAGPQLTFADRNSPRTARPARRPTSSSLRSSQSAQPSVWVRPITMESGTVHNVNRIARQFMYARTLSPWEERRSSTFALNEGHNRACPTAIPSGNVHFSYGPDPFPFDPASGPPFVMLPPQITRTPSNPGYVHLPYGIYRVWPPPNVPTQVPGSTAEHRVRCITERGRERSSYLLDEDYPNCIAQVSDRVFHICSWMEPLHNWAADVNSLFHHAFPRNSSLSMALNGQIGAIVGVGANLMAEYTHMQSFATIDPFYYTPTADKPFRGIWVGDYGGHGCEFLLLHQPEGPHEAGDPGPSIDHMDAMDPGPQLETESDEAYAARRQDSRVYRGSLEAIKLTGDPNVPRGEYSFIVSDLGAGCVLHKGLFAGARIVRSQGHVAGHGFRNDRYVDSRLIIISPDRLAQYWYGSGYVSFFHRVDIDRYTAPY